MSGDLGRTETLASNPFTDLCSGLGYVTDDVLSVRVTARRVIAVLVDAQGDLKRAVHRMPPAVPDQIPSA